MGINRKIPDTLVTLLCVLVGLLAAPGDAQTYINISETTTACFAATAGEYWFMSEASIDNNRVTCISENFGSAYAHT